MRIPVSKRSDTGKYTVTVTNENGTESHDIDVNVLGLLLMSLYMVISMTVMSRNSINLIYLNSVLFMLLYIPVLCND